MVNYIALTQAAKTYTYYFDEYNAGEAWEDFPAKMVDGILTNYADTFVDGRVQLCDHNTCPTDSSVPACTVTKVELRSFSVAAKFTNPIDVIAYLRPVFAGGDGDNHGYTPENQRADLGDTGTWCDWIDITNDTNAPGTWAWSDIASLNVDHYPDLPAGGDPYHLKTAQIDMRVTCEVDCSLTAPEEVSDNHTQNVKMMNLWNGERIVFGLSRSNWTLVLSGSEWYTGACDKILCIRDLGLDNLPLTISGLNNINWNSTWRILQFGWKIVGLKPEHIEWILELERYE